MKNPITRRSFLKSSVAAAAVGSFTGGVPISASAQSSKGASDVIAQENKHEGALDWQLTKIRLDKRNGFRSPWIEGYCSKQSVAAGETIDIMVSTDPLEQFVIEIFRTGYYGGRGARLMTVLGPFSGRKQSTPPVGENDFANVAGMPPLPPLYQPNGSAVFIWGDCDARDR